MRADIYVHASKDSNGELAEELGLERDAAITFLYACCEVRLTVEVDEKTGEAVIVEVDGRKVAVLDNPIPPPIQKEFEKFCRMCLNVNNANANRAEKKGKP